MRYLSKILEKRYDPIRSIEWVIAICTLIGGSYIFTPLYQVSVAKHGMTALASALTYPTVIFIFGAVLLLGALLVIVGLWKNLPQIKSVGLFLVILARIFQILTVWVTGGFLPLLWIYPLTITIIVIVLWFNTRVGIRNDSS